MKSLPGALTMLCLSLAAHAGSEGAESAASAATNGDSYPRVELRQLVAQVSRRMKKPFLVAANAPSTVVVGTLDAARVDYPTLLTILENNGMTAIQMEDVVNVVPIAAIRQYATPISGDTDRGGADDEWVTRVMRLQRLNAAQVVPVLRPMMPQAAHLAALPDQRVLLIVDRRANVRRIETILRELDRAAAPGDAK